jgi:hypothetical protein
MKFFTLTLANLNHPRDICYIMEQRQVKYFTYTFQSNEGVIKHGKAADNEWMYGTWGNRLYRQVGGLNGWSIPLNDTSAKKMRDQMNIHFPSLTRMDVTVTVYDYTEELEGEDEKEIDRVLLNEEDAMVKKHISQYGAPPKLNIQKTRTRTKPCFNKLFEVLFNG